MKFFKTLVVFLIINFGALSIGSFLMDNGPQSQWYTQLNQAPWTPDGWVFGVAWTTIMICFSLYMAYLYSAWPSKKVKVLFSIQVVLNVSWNYVFFNQQLIAIGLATIIALTIIVIAFFLTYLSDLKGKSILILPYIIWLCIATSLNLYILLYN